MSFDFQINNQVEWALDKELLHKAEIHKPVLNKKQIHPNRIVELVTDKNAAYGFNVLPSPIGIEQLSQQLIGKDESIILDLGNHYVGTFSVSINSVGSPMDAPLYLRLKFAEIPAELGFDSQDYKGWLSKSWIQEEYIHIDVLPKKLELPRRYSCRFIEIEVLDTSPKWKASFENPIFISESAVDMKTAASSKITDPELSKIYDVSLKTLADCMQDVFEDGPKRDRRLWLGDLRLQASANYKTFQSNDLVKRCLYLFGGMTTKEGKIPANVFTAPALIPDDTFLFDYSLFFVSILEEYFHVTNDIAVLKDLYPVSKKQIDLALALVDSEGRLNLQDDWPVFIDWSDDFDKRTAAQGVLIYCLKSFCLLAKEMRDLDYTKYVQQLEKLESFAKQKLFNEEKQQFIIEGTDEINCASQVWMILAGVFSPEINKQIAKKMILKQFPVKGFGTPYMYHHLVEALFIAGSNQEAITLMKTYWGKMIELGADTFWEAFKPETPDFSPYGSPIISSFCHAWSCTPVTLINTYLK
ncbi:alpha-L-rhamnosidase-related protein [Enterococcus sp. RIT-PI-f]|uniref:alpha-L-rhamnosidase-related protein n=1 Tax=Enterococcus sp. RIT-PI-f TaxID=1690244 RepID=UPI0006BA060D|nr:family 78 glycoside hydrolase catalytic domain [Enterococcus sp. RIT-PI-f]KPG70433.1 alpha-rhamnosidase [Enterococcus sp. RIT-PI-f]